MKVSARLVRHVPNCRLILRITTVHLITRIKFKINLNKC